MVFPADFCIYHDGNFLGYFTIGRCDTSPENLFKTCLEVALTGHVVVFTEEVDKKIRECYSPYITHEENLELYTIKPCKDTWLWMEM